MNGEHCATCADAATPMRVVSLEPPLCVDADGATQPVALDLVEAATGDEVLVHAGVAIARTDAGRAP